MTTKKEEQGLRFNEGKTRHALVPAYAQEQYARVMTAGAKKYAERNWERGMKWTKVVDSLKRHILAFESGEDYDPETGELHMAHAMCNAAFLTEYYRIAPHYDDRPHAYLRPQPRLGLDIDEVLADWVGHWTRYHGQPIPQFWNFDRDIVQKFEALSDNKDFWLTIPARCSPADLPYEPFCYITSRSVPEEWTQEWLDHHGFPSVPVYNVGAEGSKAELAQVLELGLFVDDRFEHFVEMNKAGVCCFLMDAPHNQRYDVGYKRIHSLKELRR